jgi:hypothetical protein
MDETLVQHTLRLYGRYQQEIVEHLNLCPWAMRARLDGKVRLQVCLQTDGSLDPTLDAIREFEADPQVEIALLLFPRLDLDRLAFERFVADAVKHDAARATLKSPAFAFAAFHPSANLDSSKPERLIPFWRRTPDPTIQLVRLHALERVRHADPPGTQFVDLATVDFTKPLKRPGPSLRQRISEANSETLTREGLPQVEALFASIREDHWATRRALGLPVAGWEAPCD